MTRKIPLPRRASRAAALLLAASTLGLFGVVGAGCLSRPVVSQEPTTKTSFTADVRQAAIDKVDLLFAIDNSASMGDKQEILAEAVPDLLDRLLNPQCVLIDDPTVVRDTKSSGGDCGDPKYKPEFQPVQDIHIGIVSSALGNRGGNACPTDPADPKSKDPTNNALSANNDDAGHLINRPLNAEGQGLITNFQPSAFLSWLPVIDKNKEKLANRPPGLSPALGDSAVLINDFKDQVVRVREFGCGFEAQLESVYRFLVQPDPYKEIKRPAFAPNQAPPTATLSGVDAALLKQRAQFLRPDSLVAVIMVTDENESTVDPLALGGRGWTYINSGWLGNSSQPTAAKGTTTCDATPNDPKCTSCAVSPTPADPNCTGSAFLDGADDALNIRMFHMKQRFGLDAQYPVERYVRGFTQARVPNRNAEHPLQGDGKTPSGFYDLSATPNCTNPLFAKSLPTDVPEDESLIESDLCKLARGPRTADLVFFALIGGVPWQLLSDQTGGTIKPKAKLEAGDWTKILGADPLNYNFDGADLHMLESSAPRAGLPDPSSTNTADPIHGREYITRDSDTKAQTKNGVDLQYACTFKLPTPKDCTDTAKYDRACDCTVSGLSKNKNSPLCENNPSPSKAPVGDESKNTLQVRGKAYPTIRQLSVVKALGDQGIAASICPITLDDKASANYGYRPAVNSIVDRLRNALSTQCLPEKLTKDDKNAVPCLILETLPVPGDQKLCDDAVSYPGRKQPNDQILARFRADQKAAQGDAGQDLSQNPVCELAQLTVPLGATCAASTDSGWCYVENGNGANPAGTCAQAIIFSPSANTPGSRISLNCIKATETVSSSDAATKD